MLLLPKAILLDMDDTIMALEHGIDVDGCWRKACGNHLAHLDEPAVTKVIQAIKKQAGWYWSDAERHRVGRLDLLRSRTEIIEAALTQSRLADPAFSARIAADFGATRDLAMFLFPGAIETIRHIQSLGIPTALITNGASNAQRWKINRFGLDSLFEHIWIEEEFGSGKPHDLIYLHAVSQLGVKPEETWMVGDNYEWEIVAPQRLGIRGIWINHRQVDLATLPIQPYASIGTLSDLVPLLHD